MKIDTSLKAINLGKPEAGRTTARIVQNGKPVIAGICLHDTAGTGRHNDTLYLAHPGDGRAVSVDFTVERDGSVYQLNPDLRKFYTFHAGRSTRFQAADGRKYLNRDVTRVLLGIELCQKADMSLSPVWPAEQIEAAAELCLFLAQTFGFGKDQITTHARIITDGSRSDPREFPMSSFWFFFNRHANVPAIDPPAGTLTQPVTHTIIAGDNFWRLARKYNTTIEAIKALNGINDASNVVKLGQVLIIKK